MQKCPCGSGKEYSVCCGPLLDDHQAAATPEALMRSRYTAYVKQDVDYIMHTMAGPAKRKGSEDRVQDRAEQIEWLGLEILKVLPVTSKDKIGFVEFIARFRINGKDQFMHEISEFHKEHDKWFYFDGKHPQPGRNDPCPCGSGKKYKKCCCR